MRSSKVYCDRMLLSFIKGDKPHVMVIHSVVNFVKKFVKSPVVGAVSSTHGIHVPWIGSYTCLADRDRFALIVNDLKPSKAHIE